MDATISASVGEGAVNKPSDVATIDQLLKDVGMLEDEGWLSRTFRRVGGVGDAEASARRRISAIKRFQEIWKLTVDGKIDKNGVTIGKLNRTKQKLVLKQITKKRIKQGGYKISYTHPDPPPPPYEIWLGVTPEKGDYIDVSGRDRKDVLSAENLPDLLTIIDKRRMWGQKLDLKLFVVMNGQVISTSDLKRLECPIYPHDGRLLPLNKTNNGGELTYQGDTSAASSSDWKFWGRWLQSVEGFDGRYFFAVGFDPSVANPTDVDSSFETDNDKRGFDCITYVGTVCGAPPQKLGATPKLVEWLEANMSATECSCEVTVAAAAGKPATTSTAKMNNASIDHVKQFFKKNGSGYYVMWDGGHVVFVVNGEIHEFSSLKKTYNHDINLETWLDKHPEKKNVRKLGKKPPRAG